MRAWFLFAVMLTRSIMGASWYVDNAASGINDGTSWANAWTNLNSIAGVSGGDTVYISGGTTSKTYLDPYWTPAGGTDGNPVTYRIGQDSGHNGLAVFDGSANSSWLYGAVKNVSISGNYNGSTNFLTTNCTGTAVHTDGAYKLSLEYIRVDGEIRMNPATNVTIANCIVRARAPSTYCLLLSSDGLTESHTNNSILNNVFLSPVCSNTTAWGSDGIKGGGRSTIRGNVFDAYYVTNNSEFEHNDGIQSIGQQSHSRVYGNRFRNVSNYAIFWEMQGSVNDVWIYNNLFEYTDSNIASNLSLAISLGQRTAGSTVSNVLIAANTISDFYGRSGITIGDDLGESNTWTYILVANNLMINTGPTAALEVSLTGGGTNGFAILNNKAIAWSSGSTNISPSQLVYPSGGTNLLLVSYQSLSGANDYRPALDDTAARDAGSDLAAYFTDDFTGATRVAPWDIGAYEYVGTRATVGTVNVGTLIIAP